MRSTRLFSPSSLPIKTLILVMGVIFFLTACGGTSPTLEEESSGELPQIETPEATEVDTGSPTDETSTGSGIDACSLLTKEDAETVLGKPVNDPVAEIVPPVYSCDYQTAEYDVVSVSVVEYSSPVEAEAGFQMAIDINDYEEVSDIGDRAYRGIVYDITVLTGKYELSVDINDSSEDEEAYQKAKGLAESALSRMP